jgi:hypothetical protein
VKVAPFGERQHKQGLWILDCRNLLLPLPVKHFIHDLHRAYHELMHRVQPALAVSARGRLRKVASPPDRLRFHLLYVRFITHRAEPLRTPSKCMINAEFGNKPGPRFKIFRKPQPLESCHNSRERGENKAEEVHRRQWYARERPKPNGYQQVTRNEYLILHSSRRREPWGVNGWHLSGGNSGRICVGNPHYLHE